MTFKDLLRLLRRRWPTAVAAFALVFAGFVVFSAVKERPTYRARASVIIATPPLFLNAQSNQWITIDTKDLPTWISIIRSRRILDRVKERLRPQVPGWQDAWADSVQASAEGGRQIVWIEAVAPTADVAAAIANAAAEEAVRFGREDARNEQLRAIERAGRRAQDERRLQQREIDEIRRLRAEARARFGSESVEVDFRKLQEDIQGHEVRLRELERRISSTRLRLERLRSDRSVVEHLQRETLPRAATVQVRIQENPRVRAAVERLEGLYRTLHGLRRRYTDEHPSVIATRDDLREAELELTRTQFQALGRDLDAEELSLRADAELAAIERRVLEPELRELRARLESLAPAVEEIQRHERLAAEAAKRVEQVEALRVQLETSPEPLAYVTSLDPARADDAQPVELRLRKSWPVALLAGVIVGLSFAFLMDFLDTSLRTDYDVRRHLDWPVLAVVPKVSEAEVLGLRAVPASALPEIFDTLATVLLSLPSTQPPRVFLVTSTNPREGKTAASVNLAVALARQGRRTLLLDGDLRAPSIHRLLALPNDAGVSELLAGTVTLGDAGIFQDVPEVPNLKVITSGASPGNPYELLDAARVGALMAPLRDSFDAVVLDTPPVLRTGDALKFSSAADAVLFVVESGRTDQRQATWAKRLLENVQAKVAGVVLNQAARESEEYYYYYGHRKETRAV
ncbi:MAG TPA: polysaccharide biosynthesis tyrosine autokinase [Planctomycetota bacterium]|nr:polysaccharide biosynthesis tyrosine autokinase [Planctomycetota bacterium]